MGFIVEESGLETRPNAARGMKRQNGGNFSSFSSKNCVVLQQIAVDSRFMRISVDIDEATLRAVMLLTGERRKSPALSKAVIEFVRRRKAREFGRLIREGAFDYPDPGPAHALDPVPPLRAE